MGVLFSCAVGIGVLAGCAGGGLNSVTTGVTGPATGTGVTGTTSVAVASSADPSRSAASAASVRAAAQRSSAAASSSAARSAAEAAAALAERSASEQSEAEATGAGDASSQDAEPPFDQSPVDQGGAGQQDDQTSSADDDASVNGWYDERGWVSPQTAARALAAGIAPGGNVPDYLRCGTICGEDPTSGEIQAQKSAEEESARAQATSTTPPCAYMVVRGVCYTSPEEAAAAGE